MNIDKQITAIPNMSAAERAGMRTNAARWLATGTPDQKAAAEQLMSALDHQEEAEVGALHERLKHLPAAGRVVGSARGWDPPTVRS